MNLLPHSGREVVRPFAISFVIFVVLLGGGALSGALGFRPEFLTFMLVCLPYLALSGLSYV